MADAARIVDQIDLTPRFTVRDVDALNARFADVATAAMVDAVLKEKLLDRVALVSSFGAESAVLLHLVAQADPATPILFLDTGKHFDETLTYRDELAAHLGLSIINLAPDATTLAARDDKGLRWSYDPDGCCEIRKVAPLDTALADYDASITGRKGFQSGTRASIKRFELDGATGRIKWNPLASWTKAELDAYFEAHDLPRHPLEAQGYLSIGCAPCTSKVAPGEDPRSGRWKGWDKVECGIHVPLKPGEEPVF